MTGFLALPHPFPQIGEALALDNDDAAEYLMRLALTAGFARIANEFSDPAMAFPASRLEYVKQLLDAVCEKHRGDALQIAVQLASSLSDEPPF